MAAAALAFSMSFAGCRRPDTPSAAAVSPRAGEFVRLEIAAGEDLRNESFAARRIVRVGDTSFIGYSELVDEAWHIRVRAYDHARRILGSVHEVASGTDDHSIMALAADAHGILHCVTGGHGAVVYTHTLRPADASAWTPPETVSPEGTYSMMVIDREDRLFIFYRREWTNLEMRSRPAGGPRSGAWWNIPGQAEPSPGPAWCGPRVFFRVPITVISIVFLPFFINSVTSHCHGWR